MKYKWLLVIACLLMTACNGTKQDPEKDKDSDKDKDKSAAVDKTDDVSKKVTVKTLLKEFETELTEFSQALQKVPKDKQQAFQKENMPTPDAYIPRFAKVAEENAGTDEAVEALLWLASNANNDIEAHEKALDAIFRDHVGTPNFAKACIALSRGKPNDRIADRFEAFIKESDNREARGVASHSLVSMYQMADMLKPNVDADGFAEYFGEESCNYIKNFELDSEKMEGLLQSIVDDYADIEIPYGRASKKIGEIAEASLFEIKYLSVGKVAPDIEGADLDGVNFKLSDYRGKVVMIDFWGDW